MLIKAITGKGAYAAKPGPSKSERAANRGFALFSIVLTLSILVMGVIFYVGIKSFVRHSPPQPGRTVFEPTKSRSLIEHAIDRYAGSESLSLLPEPISISEVNVSSALEFSYYGMTFDVPWKESPSIITSTPNNVFTFLRFLDSKKVIEVFAPTASLSPIAKGARGVYISGLKQGSHETLNISEVLRDAERSDYDFVSAALNSSQSQVKLDDSSLDESLIVATGLLPTKAALIDQLNNDLVAVRDVSAIDSFSTKSLRGFQFVGTFTNGTSTGNAAHFLIFDGEDKPYDLTILGATQDEDNFVLATLRTK